MFLPAVFAGWTENRAPRLGAPLAYSTTRSIAPLLLVIFRYLLDADIGTTSGPAP